jgi:hypothetical protein
VPDSLRFGFGGRFRFSVRDEVSFAQPPTVRGGSREGSERAPRGSGLGSVPMVDTAIGMRGHARA